VSTSRPLFDAPLNLSEPARLRLRELAAIDAARFDPSVLETDVRDAVAAWAAAMDGDDEVFGLVASEHAFDAIVHPCGVGTRTFIRGLQVERIWIEEPIRIARGTSNRSLGDVGPQRVVFLYSGRRFVEDLATGEVLLGSRESELCFDQTFDLYPDGTPDSPWRVAEFRFTLLAPVGEFLSCRETTEEYYERLELFAPSPPNRRFRIHASWAVPDVKFGGETNIVVERERPPTDEEACELTIGHVFCAMKERGDLDLTPRYPLIRVRELRERPHSPSLRCFQIHCHWQEDETHGDGELSIPVEFRRAPTRPEAEDLLLPHALAAIDRDVICPVEFSRAEVTDLAD
jgi:hypothetical protein